MKNEKEHHRQPSNLAVLLLFLLIFLQVAPCAPAAAVNPPSADGSPQARPADPPETSPYWRAFIWEALPAEWLNGQDRNAVLEAYQLRDWKPFFITSRFEPAPGADELIRRIQAAEAEGIDTRPFQLDAVRARLDNLAALRAALRALDPDFADVRAVLSDKGSFEGSPSPAAAKSGQPGPAKPAAPESNQAAQREKEQKYKEAFREASEIDIELANRLVKFSRVLNPFAGDELVQGLQGEIPMTDFLSQLEPASPHYRPLIPALGRYRQLAETHQVPFNDKVPVKPGENSSRVTNLQKRLQQEDFYTGRISGTYDRETQEAVRAFQRAHLLQPDGTVGQRTKDWLNVPFRRKADTVARALKLTRESQVRPIEHGRFIRINIPEFMLEYYKDGVISETHRIIVGRAGGKKVKFQGRMVGENQTPTLSSAIDQIVINPRWYVSDRISMELNNEAGGDPTYWTRHGYVQMASRYPWGQPRIFQLPGPSNALGRVKFEFPNPYAIYLHDTPRRYLFQNARRDYSHGCIRVDKAQGLARIILTDEQNAAAQKIEAYLELKNPSYIKLSQPVPIVIEYIPASTAENGQVLFPGDPYGVFQDAPEVKS